MRTLLALLLLAAALAPRPAHATFSIVARDPKTGELGVAVQSHWFDVGAIVPWAKAGVGAVATQANAEPGYGPRALALLEKGKTAKEALDELLKADPQRELRQVAIVDAKGNVAVHTGKQTIPFAGHQTGKGYSVEANLMSNDRVWPAMAKAYEAHDGPLAERLLAALQAAQKEGGDVRGQQSAAILVVSGKRSDAPWAEVEVNLRVDDAKAPLVELERLYKISRAYDQANRGDALTADKKFDEAAEAYREAARLAPGNEELEMWAAFAEAAAGHVDQAAAMARRVFKAQPGWARLLPYLRETESPGVPVLQKKLGVAQKPR